MLENFRLRVFRAVAQHLNFSRAARELLLTQPAVTQQIRALEDELGVALFDRTGGRIALTAAGRALVPFTAQIRSLGEEAIAAVAAASGQQAGALALGASQTIAQYLLPYFMANFSSEHPQVRLSAQSGNSDAMLQALRTQDIQLALIEAPEQRRDLHVEPFMEDHMVLVVPAGHPWADQPVQPAALPNSRLLMREFGSGSRRVVEQALVAAGLRLRDLHIALELDSTEGLLSAVEAGLGITFVSRWAVRNQLALGTLRVAHVRGLRLSRPFSFAYPAGPEPAGNVGSFCRMLRRRATDLVPRAVSRAARSAGAGK